MGASGSGSRAAFLLALGVLVSDSGMVDGMSAAVVAIDGDVDSGGAFRALVERSRWNGWARAWFARGEVERMAADPVFFCLEDSDASALRFVGPDARVLLEGDSSGDDGPGVYWRTVARRVFSDGVERFRVGDGWIWDEVECPGHESLSGADMGASVFCDGSCAVTL